MKKNEEPIKTYFNKSLDLDTDKAQEISKAFQAGTSITPQTQTDGAALRLESMDNNLKNTTWGRDDFTIYNDIFKQPVDQTVRKYVQFYKHGRVGHSLFQPEIGIGDVNTPHLDQKTVNMKFIVDTKSASLAMQLANTMSDPMQVLEMDGVENVVKTIEWAIYYGDADLTTGQKGDGLEFDGLQKLIDKNNHIDLNGGELTPQVLNAAAIKIGKGFGTATDAYMPIGIKADFINQHLGAQRIVLPGQTGGMTTGLDIDRFLSARGNIQLHGSTIMDLDNKLDLDNPDIDDHAPLAPTFTATAVTGQNGKFHDKDVVDKQGNVLLPKEVGANLVYRVTASGQHGDSLSSDPQTVTVANPTDGVKLVISQQALNRSIPDYVTVYRQSLIEGDEEFYLVARIAGSEIQADGTIEFVDTNLRIPGTGDVFVGQINPLMISLLTFAPLAKLDLARVTTASQFAILWYGALAVYYPRRFVQIHNVMYNSPEGNLGFNNNI
ncbi:major capsid protein [Lactobacillus phage LpeD]|uniref:Major capsid protein n=1 Tax=Lactobacillus phage LpeD TaxID=2041210 RepID=A0A291I9F1_9CAUD|nr:major head protein [Lactobacillus phage LpeD]ATG86318.1 major capsid protein [Lactobacillus phage LpeD]